jgi:hypothetical protein
MKRLVLKSIRRFVFQRFNNITNFDIPAGYICIEMVFL